MSAVPPLTLTQASTLLSGASTEPCAWNAGASGFTGKGKHLLDRLIDLSARHGTIHFLCDNALRPDQLKALMTELGQRRPGLRLSLSCLINSPVAADFMAGNDCGAIVQIQWHVTGPLPNFRFFKAFSKADVWNHLVLDGAAVCTQNCKAISRQPNIIHSWETTRSGGEDCDPDSGYGHVRPLSGQPLWKAVNDPMARFLLVDRFGKNWLLRSRVDGNGDRLYAVGETLAYTFVTPERLPDGYLDEICAMVAAGGTVSTTHVRANLKRAFLIGYVEERGAIVANSSLKNPRSEYIDNVRHQSGLDLSGYVERGYTSVRPEYRGLGIGTSLLAGLTARAGGRKIFSVISEDNEATKIIAMRNHTRRVATYFSAKAGKPVGIWMPAWMIDSDNKKG
jgi:GNAT superfamily N-acetyltransferase